jgi:hypothetical protein
VQPGAVPDLRSSEGRFYRKYLVSIRDGEY